MRPLILFALAAGSFLSGVACSRQPADRKLPQTEPTMLILNRGVDMPLESVVPKISFRPFLPAAQIARIAVIPPLGGEDARQNRGIAVEYSVGGERLLLSEWPRQNFALIVGESDLGATPCAVRAYKADGAIWLSRTGLVMTLQPDGKTNPENVFRLANGLAKKDGC